MSAGNVFRRWAAAIRNGETLPALASGESYSFVPEVDDDNFYFGDGTLSWDMRIYGSAAANYISWDASANDLKFEDNVSLMFGTGSSAGEGAAGDIEIRWDGTDLDILQSTVNSSVKWGVSGAGMDRVWYGDDYDMTWDQSVSSLLFGDNAKISIGTGDDVQVYWDATKLVAKSPTGVWINPAPSKLDPNFSSTAYEFFDDFFEFDETATIGGWVYVEDDAANTVTLTDDVAGGVVKLTGKATTDNNALQISSVSAPFLLAAGKHLWYECRIRGAAGATEIDIIAGLCALGEDMTGVADNRFQDGIGFFKSDDSLNLSFGSSKNGTDTGTLADVGADWTTGWHTLGFYVNGLTSATPYYDGTAGTAITATFCDDESLAPIFMVRNGDGTTTQTLEIDYVRVIQLR